jgi:predicted RNA-binding protein with PUA-like domain
MPGLGRAMRLVTPSPHSGSRTSSTKLIGCGTRRDSYNSFQKRFDGPAKWCPVCADRTPGLIPTSSTRTPGWIRSVSLRLRQSGLESSGIGILRIQQRAVLMKWLFKEEPSHYSYDDLVRDGKTSWTGVRNPLAQKHLRSVKKGDEIFFYHTGDEKSVVGIARAAGNAYLDPADKTGKLSAVDVTPVKKLRTPVTLASIKADRRFASFPLTRVPRLSVMPVSDDEWELILSMSK